MIDASTILLTGGTGSFGRVMAEHLLEAHNPAKVIVYSRGEEKQVAMRRELDDKRLRFFIGDVRDRDRLMLAFNGVDYVIHSAALKHVDVCQYNPLECKKTNVDGAANIIDAAIACKVKKVLAVSSDKAVNPVNAYGACKLVADYLFIDANKLSGRGGAKFSVIRFGNFEWSSGSVIPYFHKLLMQGAKTLPVTDLRMTRYFIPLENAVQYAVRVLELMKGGEIYIPKMRRIRIETLARDIHPSGGVVEVGRRPGEKLHEQLLTEPDTMRAADCGDHYLVSDYSRNIGRPVTTVLSSSGEETEE